MSAAPSVCEFFRKKTPVEGRPILIRAPLINLGKLYATAQGGIPSYSFVSNRAIHGVVIAQDMLEQIPATPDPRYTLDLLDPRNAGDQASPHGPRGDACATDACTAAPRHVAHPLPRERFRSRP